MCKLTPRVDNINNSFHILWRSLINKYILKQPIRVENTQIWKAFNWNFHENVKKIVFEQKKYN